MTQEHREQFLATEGWQQTERGHVRKHWWGDHPSVPSYGSIWITHMARSPVKFRRLPFGRQPKHDALVGWLVLQSDESMERYGGLRELVQYADQPTTLWDDGWMNMQIIPDSNVRERLYLRQRNKRQGWKTIEVGDGEKKEKVVVEVMG